MRLAGAAMTQPFEVFVYTQPTRLQWASIYFRHYWPIYQVGLQSSYLFNPNPQPHGRRRRRRYHVRNVSRDLTIFLFALLIGCLLGALFEAGQR
jgi:hypothetical protein